jgi:hypothetical protein
MIAKDLPFLYMYRNDELVNLTGADIQWNQVSDTGHDYFSITLIYRKTNQTDEKKGTTRTSMPSFFVCHFGCPGSVH